MRPHPSPSWAHRDFTARRLIRDAFAVRERLGDPRAVPGFRCSFLPDMPSSMTSGSSIIVSVQQHSVRGFLAGVVRKKLGLNLVSEQTDKGRVYRIKDGKASTVAADRAKQAA